MKTRCVEIALRISLEVALLRGYNKRFIEIDLKHFDAKSISGYNEKFGVCANMQIVRTMTHHNSETAALAIKT